jgi:hypothetical protein
MAILNADQLAELRRSVSDQVLVDYNKPIINAALQKIEDVWESNRGAFAASIDTATAPYTFSNAAKKQLMAYWMLQKFGRERS